jgi:large subunit ribosomal protein L15
MDLSTLKPAKGSVNHGKRLGRGQGSGKGGTSTKGHKGAKARSGDKTKKGFEGGQMPLQRRIPKYGFKNINRKEYKAINLSTIQKLVDEKGITDIDVNTFIEAGLLSKNKLVKILGKGELTKKVNIKAHAFSKSAIQAIESLEGTATKI